MDRQTHGKDEDHSPPSITYTSTGMSSSIENKQLGRKDTAVRNAEEDIDNFARAHAWDPNFSNKRLSALENVLEFGDAKEELQVDRELIEISPYPEVNASVHNTDNPDLPVSTIRAWFLGMVFVMIGSGVNLLLNYRDPAILITPLVIQLLVYPIGLFLARVLPNHQFTTFGLKWSLNPGPFNKKEHALITIMANVAFPGGSPAYAADFLMTQRQFYKVNWGVTFALLFMISSQMLGLGLAGMFKSILVYPASMIWPTNLPICALFNTLHDTADRPDPEATNGWKIGRYRFFLYVLIGGFIWYWFPGYLFTALSLVSWIVWAAPNNVTVARLFGGKKGLGLFGVGSFTLDWTTVAGFLSSPLVYPAHALWNMLIAFVVFIWIASSAIGMTGAWYSDYLPISSNAVYDNTAEAYNTSRVLTTKNTLNVEEYQKYSPLYLSTTFAINYGLSFAAISAVIFHCILYHGKEILSQIKKQRSEPKDIHGRLYERYKDTPVWWFGGMFILTIVIGILSIVLSPLKEQLPIWAFLFSLLIAIVFIVPIGIVQGITNVQLGLNVFTEMIISYMLPGRPFAMMAFKTFGYITMLQGLTYAQDQKLAMYMKVAPRIIFWGQMIASVWSCFVQLGVYYWVNANISEVCSLEQPNNFSCPNTRTFASASYIWGLIGAKRIFGGSSPYASLQWFWLLGAATPVIFWLLMKKFPKGPFKYLNAPVLFGGLANMPPASATNYFWFIAVGLFFNGYLRRRAQGWWLNYNYILSAALDSGLAFATIVVFLAVGMQNIDPPKWWGNTFPKTTLDGHGSGAVKIKLEEGQTFGPSTWE